MAKKRKIKVRQMVIDMNFEVLAGEKGLDSYIVGDMINRPGMEINGIFGYTESERLVVIGLKESNYLNSFPNKVQTEKIVDLFVKLAPPAFVLSANMKFDNIKKKFIEVANKYNIPVLLSELATTPLLSTLYFYLHKELAERESIHGVLVDIYGMGTLIIGKSGVGKSETALELIKRGHMLVSDDLVEIYESTVGNIIGTAPCILRRYMEIRGIGIVDVLSMFGTGSYRENKKISLVVELERLEEGKIYDRLGIDELKTKFFNTEIPKVIIPVFTGRNVSTLVESAAMNQKLKSLGVNAAVNFTEAVTENIMKGQKENNE